MSPRQWAWGVLLTVLGFLAGLVTGIALDVLFGVCWKYFPW